MANRLLTASLTKKLSSLEQAANFPIKPNMRPSTLYVRDVLNPVNLPPPGKGSPREFYLKEIHKRVNSAWRSMDPSLKGRKDFHTPGYYGYQYWQMLIHLGIVGINIGKCSYTWVLWVSILASVHTPGYYGYQYWQV